MKRVILTILSAVALVACSSSSSDDIPTPTESGVGTMYLDFSASNEIEIVTKSRASSIVEIPEAYIPAADDFKLTITGSYWDPTSETYMDFYEEYESISAYNSMEEDDEDPQATMPPYLVAGEYTAVMEYGEGIYVESPTNAHFRGEVSFTVVARKNDATTSISATLQNSIVKLTTTDYFKSYFAQGATLNLSTTQQTTLTVDTTVDGSEDQLLFVSPGTTLYLSGEGVKQDPGDGSKPTVVFTKSSIGVSKVQTLSTVVVDADDAGGESISVTLDDTFTEINETTVDLHD